MKADEPATVIHSSEIADDPGGFHGEYVPAADYDALEAKVSRLLRELEEEKSVVEMYRDKATESGLGS